MVILGVVLAAYIVLTLFLALRQERMIFFPDPVVGATPEAAGIPFERVTFTAADGVRLAGWYVPASGARVTILFCHGNGGNIGYLLETVKLCARLGYNLLLFDYRGYGESEGTPDEEGIYRDTEAAWNYLQRMRGGPPASIVVHGRSLGGAAAAWLARRHVPDAVIIESAFTSLGDVAASAYPLLPVRLMLRHEFPTLEHLRDVRSPVLIIHSPGDEIVPFAHGEALYAAARGPKEFLRIDGGHNDGVLLSAAAYGEGIRSFVARHTRAGAP
jgi:fermentation-respiration switch protein FrsA (DUF1100 family)